MLTVNQKIGFIGAGQMARALARGFVVAKLAAADQIWAADPFPPARDGFARDLPGSHLSAENHEVAEACDVVVLAVKPQQIGAVLDGLKPVLTGRHLVISIAAGVSLAHLASKLAPGVRLVRVMPNTPCLVGQSASAYCLGPGATDDDGRMVGQLLEAVGWAFRLEEKLLDAVTGLSGSGPAFVFTVIESLSDGGVLMGLPREVATVLAAQTVLGSAQMVLTAGEHLAVLRDRVASPGGTTIAGMQALEAGGLRAALIGAVEAATRRCIELGKG